MVPADITLTSLVSVRNCIRQPRVDCGGKRNCNLGIRGSSMTGDPATHTGSAWCRILVCIPIPIMLVVGGVLLRRVEYDLQDGGSMNFGKQLYTAPHGLTGGETRSADQDHGICQGGERPPVYERQDRR